jgi:hypothetical protein
MVLLGGLCGWRSARLALGMTPLGPPRDDAEYHFREWQAASGEDAAPEIDRALELNPRYTAAWIARGLGEETEGERPKAEVTLLHAAEVDHTYLPRWTLANFYLRQGDTEKFWTWARRAAEMAYDPSALFQLCWQASGDAREILDRAVPPEPRIRRQYFDFLVRTKRLEAARPLVQEIARTADADDLTRMLEYCDAEIVLHHSAPALEAWNALAARHVIPYGALDPRSGGILTNGDFLAQPLRQGFDWRTARVEGAALFFDTAAREMTISLGGRQPEFCDFVEQYVPVTPGASYRLCYRYRTRELSAQTGLGFSFLDARTAVEFASGNIAAAPRGWRQGSVEFSTPEGCELLRILLQYRRPAGSVRAEGGAVFEAFTLERAN